MQILSAGGADFGLWGATSGHLLTYGLDEFAGKDWGTAALRLVWPTINQLGMPMALPGEANMKTAYDLKGKRLAYMPGNAARM